MRRRTFLSAKESANARAAGRAILARWVSRKTRFADWRPWREQLVDLEKAYLEREREVAAMIRDFRNGTTFDGKLS